jgi:rubrerythrin
MKAHKHNNTAPANRMHMVHGIRLEALSWVDDSEGFCICPKCFHLVFDKMLTGICPSCSYRFCPSCSVKL